MNEYNKFSKKIKAPDALKERTISAVREEIRKENFGRKPKETAKTWHIGQRILAAACAFGIILGGSALWQKHSGKEEDQDMVSGFVKNTFGISAYAADTGETIAPMENNRLFFDMETAGGGSDGQKGMFTGDLIKIQGENIKELSIKMSSDRVGMYRQKTLKMNRKEEGNEVFNAMINGEDPRVSGADDISCYSNDFSDNPENWSFDVAWLIGSEFTEQYDTETVYGFWVEPAETIDESEDLREAWHRRVDMLNDVTMTITATFQDGTTQSQKMRLKTGKLEVYYPDEVGGPKITGEVLEESDIETPYIYGVYAELQE